MNCPIIGRHYQDWSGEPTHFQITIVAFWTRPRVFSRRSPLRYEPVFLRWVASGSLQIVARWKWSRCMTVDGCAHCGSVCEGARGWRLPVVNTPPEGKKLMAPSRLSQDSSQQSHQEWRLHNRSEDGSETLRGPISVLPR